MWRKSLYRQAMLSFSVAIFISLGLTLESAHAGMKNGFDLSHASIPESQIFQGGPPRDGIPSIDKPYFIDAKKASFLKDNDRILGLAMGKQTRAYPIKIMNWHEIVNDVMDDRHVSITFCPLCGTGMAFDMQFGDQALTLGVSGLLYQSDVLLYDRETQSLWSQVLSESINGKLKGKKLTQLPLSHTTWKDWKTRHPKTEVLSQETGHHRNYNRSPYLGYESSTTLYFEINNKPPAIYHPKEQVLGIAIKGQYKAYPFTELSKSGQSEFEDSLAGESITLHWNEQARSVYITDKKGKELVSTTAFWFAWYTFHPDTFIYKTQTGE